MPGLAPEMSGLALGRPRLAPKRPGLAPKRPGLAPKRPWLAPKSLGLTPQRPGLAYEGLHGNRDGQKGRWTDGRTDRFPPVFYRTPSPPVPSGAAALLT